MNDIGPHEVKFNKEDTKASEAAICATPTSARLTRPSRWSTHSGHMKGGDENVPQATSADVEASEEAKVIYPTFKAVKTTTASHYASQEDKDLRVIIETVKNKLCKFKFVDEVTLEWIRFTDQVAEKLSCIEKTNRELVLAYNSQTDLLKKLRNLLTAIIQAERQQFWLRDMDIVVGYVQEIRKLLSSLTTTNNRIEVLLSASAPTVPHANPYKLDNAKNAIPGTTSAKVNRSCTLCVEPNHNTDQCHSFPTSIDRIQIALRHNICLQCLEKFPENDRGIHQDCKKVDTLCRNCIHIVDDPKAAKHNIVFCTWKLQKGSGLGQHPPPHKSKSALLKSHPTAGAGPSRSGH
ncbi:hypothetical protein GCK72_015337 [Caenorhabditis remanei]|uniref:Uncharacterized protein n=1 Tax=Caenorhabditis remanei TaxID=31234 RepID=A0A6A5GUM1_CAERE|nr:hypothetical protein GCK72_015337 [Caenorhabditis remanei]KAF1758877.1 hypothetical protein GCK72_015337 [Caenorhabditis remanei]